VDRLLSKSLPAGGVWAHTYDANGNRQAATANGTPTATYIYDAADQLTSDGMLAYSYDANGNLTAAGADSFTWDWADRMASATVGGATTSYTYDGDGTRVAKTSGGTTTPYLWDRAGGLEQLASDGTTTYVQAGGGTEELDASGTPTYHLADALGSTRGVTDGAGALIGTADYDAFGAVRNSTGVSSQLGYTGEQHDAETGFTYLRARYANPTTGRFLSADSVQPNAPGTQGYNAYAYVANNPTTWTDPSGHMAEGATLVLRQNWFPIALQIAEAFAAISCAPGCLILAAIVIIILIIVVCLLDRGGPCYQVLQAQEEFDPTDDATTRGGDPGKIIRFPRSPRAGDETSDPDNEPGGDPGPVIRDPRPDDEVCKRAAKAALGQATPKIDGGLKNKITKDHGPKSKTVGKSRFTSSALNRISELIRRALTDPKSQIGTDPDQGPSGCKATLTLDPLLGDEPVGKDQFGNFVWTNVVVFTDIGRINSAYPD
jgi:RHS repeat-associated protein